MMESSKLFSQTDFYESFSKDIQTAKSFILIESPFMTYRRFMDLQLYLIKARRRDVSIVVNTKNPDELCDTNKQTAIEIVNLMQEQGITVLFTQGHHRKLAIIDDAILWEGSLNILSQNYSYEVMRRMDSTRLVKEMRSFLKLDSFLKRFC